MHHNKQETVLFVFIIANLSYYLVEMNLLLFGDVKMLCDVNFTAQFLLHRVMFGEYSWHLISSVFHYVRLF